MTRWILTLVLFASLSGFQAGCTHHHDDRYDRVGHRDTVHDDDSRVGRAVDRALDDADRHDAIDRH
jgi:hypothetical protein